MAAPAPDGSVTVPGSAVQGGPVAAVVLAAGLGKRMGVPTPKVLLHAAGRPLLAHVLATLREAGVPRIVVVEGPASPRPSDAFAAPDLAFAVQEERLGTGHAARQAERLLADVRGAILFVHGDMPLLAAASIRTLAEARAGAGCHGALLVAKAAGQAYAGLGRVFVDGDGFVTRLLEARDLAAHPEWGGSELSNVGAYLFASDGLWAALSRVGRDNAQREHYLPDVVGILRAEGKRCIAVYGEATEALGVNTPEELAQVEQALHAAPARRS